MSITGEPGKGRWFWAYHVRIENEGDAPVQLLSRRWAITDGRGTIHHVEGEGVVGEQPVIEPNSAYSYTSACPLGSASGMMVGAYDMIDLENGSRFQVDIPAFALDSPYSRRLAN